MRKSQSFLLEHFDLSRRYFLRLGVVGAAAMKCGTLLAAASEDNAEYQSALAKLEPFFTPVEQFRDVSRGKPIPHSLSEEKRAEVGLTRESWRLEVLADPAQPPKIRRPMSKADGTALDFPGLMQLAEKHAVRFAKVMTCLNIGCPLGMGIWEGVPLREIIARTQPTDNLRRVFYYGFHNDDEKQMFRSSLPIGRVWEDPFDLPPVILCYKLNGEWLNPQRGGPVRIVVPEGYGFKSIKWLTHVVLSNMPFANDTYADGNNDVESPLKTFAATLSVPRETTPDKPLPITGYAQVGISGLSKIQVWVHPNTQELPADDPYFDTAPWRDAEILSPPANWGGSSPTGTIPADTLGFDANGKPRTWPMRLGKVHWATLLPGLPPGEYTLRSRTIDEKGQAQPRPRPYRKSGHSAIEEINVVVKE